MFPTGRELYGWTPAKRVLPGAPFPPGYQVRWTTPLAAARPPTVTQWWMNSPPHRRAILWLQNRAMEWELAAKAAWPIWCLPASRRLAFCNIMALQGKYAKLRDAKGPKDAKAVLDDIVSAKEGSSFIWILLYSTMKTS